MAFEIEQGVALPARNVRWKYPFADMRVGDSFFVANRDTTQMSAACKRAGKTTGGRFITAKATKGDATGVRVWRLE